jgi:glutamate:GABA antiporter
MKKNKGLGAPIHILGLVSLILITVGAVDSIRNLPTAALFGGSLIFFFLFAAILFLFPSALVSAELVTTWPEQGGVYVWVKHAFGKKIGFLAIWFQWIENVIWFPTILSFVAGSIGYLVAPELATNKVFLISIILGSFWLVTIVNLFGMRDSARFSNFCTIFGLLLPMVLIIGLGAQWLLNGHPAQISFNWHSFAPNVNDPQLWIALTGIMLSFCGLEITTVHAHEVHEPHRNFPKALFISTGILLVTLILGSLAIAIVLPEHKISLITGIMQAFSAFLANYHLQALMPFLATFLVIGSIGGVSSWIIAPTRGLLTAAHDGHLPKHCRKQNLRGAPSTILLYQAVIVSVVVLVFLLIPTVNGSYWLLTALAAQLYMLMYILMFAAAIYLRFSKPEQKRPFRVPGGKLGMILVGGLGICGATMTFLIGFIPPHNIDTGGVWRYESILICGLIAMSLPALFKAKTVEAIESATNENTAIIENTGANE